ncbi:STM3941 family protein [Mucilaginibacter psychrotolerans]|uniref:PH domain-containing protein n=1 Tax=Mucilaginibacter psychrotolerans TaxID=1524096 RepID=A0A4Y8SJ29_9SPHI|nr:STM3941 family protein [Mucilaginibacter psychrotolerans]TFF38862.1 hypothetical protein E2R66_07610 [Mucilaginibacter psychrotolerans]
MPATATTSAPLEIPLNKSKIALMSIGSLAFVAAGVWFIIHPTIRLFGNKPNPILGYGLGIAAIAFFGFCAFYLIKKLFDTRPGLIVSEEGITDNCSSYTFGLIPWTDIAGIDVIEIGRQKLIMIPVHNPAEYMNRQSNAIMKKMAAINYRQYQTPVSITANTLQYELEDLYTLLKGKLAESKKL